MHVFLIAAWLFQPESPCIDFLVAIILAVIASVHAWPALLRFLVRCAVCALFHVELPYLRSLVSARRFSTTALNFGSSRRFFQVIDTFAFTDASLERHAGQCLEYPITIFLNATDFLPHMTHVGKSVKPLRNQYSFSESSLPFKKSYLNAM